MKNITSIVTQEQDNGNNSIDSGERTQPYTSSGVNDSWLNSTTELHVIPIDNDTFEDVGNYVRVGACPSQ